MKAKTSRESTLRMTTYLEHTLVPAGDGRWIAYTPAGALLGFAGRTEFSLRHIRTLVRLAIALRAR